MRASLFHRWFHAWACLAMMLVVVAPLLSRALADHHADRAAQHAPVTSESTAHAGMHHDMHHGSEPAAQPAADPHAKHEMGVECDYCLIAARMISLLVALLLLITAWPAVFRAVAGLIATRHAPAAGTLGARGPPAIAC